MYFSIWFPCSCRLQKRFLWSTFPARTWRSTTCRSAGPLPLALCFWVSFRFWCFCSSIFFFFAPLFIYLCFLIFILWRIRRWGGVFLCLLHERQEDGQLHDRGLWRDLWGEWCHLLPHCKTYYLRFNKMWRESDSVAWLISVDYFTGHLTGSLRFVISGLWGIRGGDVFLQEWRRPAGRFPGQQGQFEWPGSFPTRHLPQLCCGVQLWSAGDSLLSSARGLHLPGAGARQWAGASAEGPTDQGGLWSK